MNRISYFRFNVDEDELPIGHSAVKEYEDESCYISLGKGNMVRDERPVVCIDFKKLGTYVIAGGTLLKRLLDNPDKTNWPQVAHSHFFNWLVVQGKASAYLHDIADRSYTEGHADGVSDTKREMRQFLEV